MAQSERGRKTWGEDTALARQQKIKIRGAGLGPLLAAVMVRAPSQAQGPAAGCSLHSAITSCSCDSLLFQHSALEQHPAPTAASTPRSEHPRSRGSDTDPAHTSQNHGFSQVGCRLGDGQGPAVPLHLRRQGRPRPLHLDTVQRHKTSMYPSTTMFLSLYLWVLS